MEEPRDAAGRNAAERAADAQITKAGDDGNVSPFPGAMVKFTTPDGVEFDVRYGGGTEIMSPDGRCWLVDPEAKMITGEKPKPEPEKV